MYKSKSFVNVLHGFFSSDSAFLIFFARLYFIANGKARIKVYRKLAMLIENGVSFSNGIKELKQRAQDRGGKTDFEAVILSQAINRNTEGFNAGQLFEPFIPISESVVLKSFENDFEEGLNRCAKMIEATSKIRSLIISAVASPAFYISLLFVVWYVFGVKVIPVIATAIPMEKWTGPLLGLAYVSQFAASNWFFLFIGFILLFVIFVIWSLPRLIGKERVFLDRFPPYSLYRIMIGASVLQSISNLMSAGHSVRESLERLRAFSSKNPWLMERLDSTLFFLRKGENLGNALRYTRLNFPDLELIQDLQTYATLKDFDRLLMKTATEWTEESIEKVSAIAKIMNTFLLLVVGGFLMFMVLGLMSIGSMVQQLSSGGMM